MSFIIYPPTTPDGTGGMSFVGTFDTKADLGTEGYAAGDMAIVLQDEDHEGSTTIYVHNGEVWEFSGDLKVELRDFTEEKLNLETESTGTLAINQLPEGVAMSADVEWKEFE